MGNGKCDFEALLHHIGDLLHFYVIPVMAGMATGTASHTVFGEMVECEFYYTHLFWHRIQLDGWLSNRIEPVFIAWRTTHIANGVFFFSYSILLRR